MTELEERDVLARIDAAHADIALKQEQLRQLVAIDHQMAEVSGVVLSVWQAAFSGMIAGGSLVAVGALIAKILSHAPVFEFRKLRCATFAISPLTSALSSFGHFSQQLAHPPFRPKADLGRIVDELAVLGLAGVVDRNGPRKPQDRIRVFQAGRYQPGQKRPS